MIRRPPRSTLFPSRRSSDLLSGQAGGKTGYWPRVWAARGLLHAWDNRATAAIIQATTRSEEHTSELQSQSNLVCRLLLEKKKKNNATMTDLTRSSTDVKRQT